MKVTLVPEQTAPDGFAAMLTLAGNAEFTIIVIELEVAGEPVAQLTLLVITHTITSVLARVVEVYVEVVAPLMLVPLFFH